MAHTTVRVDALTLPKLSWASFAGDLAAVRVLLQEGEDVHQCVSLVNQDGQEVTGVTPLYLAAQNGHLDVCKELLRAGADAARACVVPKTGERFTPADIAMAHFHLLTWWALKGAKARLARSPSSRRVLREASRRSAALAQPLMGERGAALSEGGAMAI